MLLTNKQAFTLVELLAVVMIIALLTAIAVPQYRQSIQHAQATEALINLRTIFDAAVRYKAEHSQAPTNVQQLDVGFFDVQVESDTSYIGNFAYHMGSDRINACYVDGNGNENTYCFSAYYNHPSNGRGAMFCEHAAGWHAKYEKACRPFCSGDVNNNGVCPVNEIPH